MKMLYIDCSMGAAGDMLSSALLELFPDREETLKKLNSLGLQGVEYTAESVKRCGVSGTRLTVKYLGHEEGAGEAPHLGRPKNIFAAVHSLSAPEAVKENVEAVFGLIADAESAVHGQKMEDVHFHDTRHEAASRLAEKLTNVLELSAVTGHRDLRMLKRYYHPRAEDLAKKLG